VENEVRPAGANELRQNSDLLFHLIRKVEFTRIAPSRAGRRV